MEKQRIIIEGFAFTDKKAALKAKHEAESVSYLREQIHMENPRMVQGFYQKLMEEDVFETPVGFQFLKELYDSLAKIPEFRKHLEPLPIEKMAKFLAVESGASQAQVGVSSASQPQSQPQPQAEMPLEPEGAAEHGVEENFQQAEEMASIYEEKLEQAKQKVRSAERKQRRAEEAVRKKKSSLHASLILNFFLLLVAAGMVAIALMDNHPNIINYEKEIQNKYSQWEMELEEREDKVKEKEKELNMD